jgi:hypothetical protein
VEAVEFKDKQKYKAEIVFARSEKLSSAELIDIHKLNFYSGHNALSRIEEELKIYACKRQLPEETFFSCKVCLLELIGQSLPPGNNIHLQN